jgi:hypothetical protein
MPELVSDDDTDSEDGSPPYKSMTELSILPAILHAFDSKQLSHEAISAELDRYPANHCKHTALERHSRRTTL